MLDDYGSGTSQGSDEGSTTSTDGGVSATSTLLCPVFLIITVLLD